jgi:riboflavin kinase, archaea type
MYETPSEVDCTPHPVKLATKNLRINQLIYTIMEIRGRVVSGLGDGAKHVEKYMPHLENTLGLTFHPGTLNIIAQKVPEFNGFKKYSITPVDMGAVDCYLARIYDIECAIVIPQRTAHDPDIVEIIAPVNLRETLSLKNGDEIVCELV